MRKMGDGLPLSRLSCLAIAEEEGRAWFARTKANGLYEYEKEGKYAKLLTHFSDYAIDKNFLYVDIVKAGSVLVLAPLSASKIILYNLATDKAEYVELMPVANGKRVKYTGGANFLKCYAHRGSVYLFGFEYPAILKIDVNTKQVVYFTEWVKEVEQRISKTFVPMGYVSDYVIVGDYLWALCECADVVLRLDLRTDEIEVVDICSDLDIQCGICFDGNFWVTGNNKSGNKLLKFNDKFVLEKEITIYSVNDGGEDYNLPWQKGYLATYPIIDLGEKLLLFSVYPSHVYEFDKALEQVRIHPVFEELMKNKEERFYDLPILAPRRRGDLVCFILGNDFLWNEYDFVHDILTRYEVRAEDDEELLQKSSKVLNERVSIENEIPWNLGYKLTLSRYLEHIACLKDAETDDKKKGYKNNEKKRGVSAV